MCVSPPHASTTQKDDAGDDAVSERGAEQAVNEGMFAAPDAEQESQGSRGEGEEVEDVTAVEVRKGVQIEGIGRRRGEQEREKGLSV